MLAETIFEEPEELTFKLFWPGRIELNELERDAVDSADEGLTEPTKLLEALLDSVDSGACADEELVADTKMLEEELKGLDILPGV